LTSKGVIELKISVQNGDASINTYNALPVVVTSTNTAISTLLAHPFVTNIGRHGKTSIQNVQILLLEKVFLQGQELQKDDRYPPQEGQSFNAVRLG
jgi:hypothetical protein